MLNMLQSNYLELYSGATNWSVESGHRTVLITGSQLNLIMKLHVSEAINL